MKIDIPRRSRTCAEGNEELAPGMEYYSLISEGEDGNYQRQDFCADCWKETRAHAAYWKGKVPEKKERTVPKHRHERALELLKEAEKEEAFILATFLAHGKKLVLRQEFPKEGKIMQLYEVVATEEMICIEKIDLSQINPEDMQRIIAQKLKDD